MDPSKSKSANTSERKFISQILWLSLAGGTASFIRVSTVIALQNCLVYMDIATRCSSGKGITLLKFFSRSCGIHQLVLYVVDLVDESSPRLDRCPASKGSL